MIAPNDLLWLADRLLSSSAEAERRAGVSRAYYAAYHHVRAFLGDRCGIAFSKGADVHQTLQRCLVNSQNEILRDAGTILESLRTERNHADYDLADSRFADSIRAQLQLRRAKRFWAKSLTQKRIWTTSGRPFASMPAVC